MCSCCASRRPSRARPELSPSGARSSGGRPAEAVAFEREYPGASWLASRAMRELEVVGAKVERLVATVARRHGLSHAGLNALAVIEGNGGPLPAGEVTARMHLTSGTMTSLLDTLERKGLVQRIADADDRRRVLVDVTAAGEQLLDRLLPEVQQACAVAFDGVDEHDLQGLLDHLAMVHEAVDKAAIDDLPPPKPRRTPARLRRR